MEKATIKDATQIHKMINSFADRGDMLPRALSEIYENTRDYFVIREEDRVVACAALHIYWSDLAELRAVTVSEDRQKRGLGAQLVQACLQEAKELGIPKVFCLTYKS